MSRNYEQTIAEYDRMFENNNNDAFYSSDLNNIKDNNNDIYGLICNALKYGYVLGYKAGKNK